MMKKKVFERYNGIDCIILLMNTSGNTTYKYENIPEHSEQEKVLNQGAYV